MDTYNYRSDAAYFMDLKDHAKKQQLCKSHHPSIHPSIMDTSYPSDSCGTWSQSQLTRGREAWYTLGKSLTMSGIVCCGQIRLKVNLDIDNDPKL